MTKHKVKKQIREAHTILARDYKGWQTTRENTAIVYLGGVYTRATESFQRLPLQGLSRTIKANMNDAGVAEYEPTKL